LNITVYCYDLHRVELGRDWRIQVNVYAVACAKEDVAGREDDLEDDVSARV
jgi:hypothetical protein